MAGYADAGCLHRFECSLPWANLVSGGANLTQSDADERPALSTINNLTALVFDGDTGGKVQTADKDG